MALILISDLRAYYLISISVKICSLMMEPYPRILAGSMEGCSSTAIPGARRCLWCSSSCSPVLLCWNRGDHSGLCASGSKDDHLENALQASNFIYFYLEMVEIPERGAQGCLKH